MEDPSVISAIDEETEFNALVVRMKPTSLAEQRLIVYIFSSYQLPYFQEEEAAMLESLLGKR